MANEENLKKRKKFSAENQPANRGRKRSQFRDFHVAEEYSLDDMRKVFQGIIIPHTTEELAAIAKDKNTPALITGFISAFLHDIKRGSLVTLNFFMDRCYGRPVQAAVVEVHDMPDEVKKRMLSIFDEETAVPVKPKNIAPIKKMKPRKDEL